MTVKLAALFTNGWFLRRDAAWVLADQLPSRFLRLHNSNCEVVRIGLRADLRRCNEISAFSTAVMAAIDKTSNSVGTCGERPVSANDTEVGRHRAAPHAEARSAFAKSSISGPSGQDAPYAEGNSRREIFTCDFNVLQAVNRNDEVNRSGEYRPAENVLGAIWASAG